LAVEGRIDLRRRRNAIDDYFFDTIRDHEAENSDRTATKHKPKCERFPSRDPAARERAPGGASHEGIDVGVVPHIEHTRGAGARGNGKNCNQPMGGIEVTRCNDQSDECSEHSKRHHAWFHQREEIERAPALGQKVRGMKRWCATNL
jgi:hypothetical protein